MRDIYYVLCPISGETKFISKSYYPKIPPIVEAHPDFKVWQRRLNKHRLKPVFKILDLVKDEELDHKFEEHLESYRNKRILLFNYSPIKQYSLLEHLLKDTASDKVMIDDVGNLHKYLENIWKQVNFIFGPKGADYSVDSNIVHELITFIGTLSVVKISPDKLKTVRIKALSSPLFECLDYTCSWNWSLKYLQKNKEKGDFLFSNLMKHDVEAIANALNHLFALFQIRLILNSQVLEDFYGVYGFSINKKEFHYHHRIMELCTTLSRDKTKKLSNKEFEEMTDKTHLFIEKNLEFAYSGLDEEELLNRLEGN